MSDDSVAQVVPGEDFQYYSGRYWNNLDYVVRELNRRATGDPDLHWHDHLREQLGIFERALILNCGNGWVERDLVEKGVIKSAVGIDFSAELLKEAAEKAAENNMQLEYVQLDTNTASFPDGEFDLVVNHAALHHVAYIDRVARKLCDLLTPNGVLVSWDYVGSHRNQYSARQWEAAWNTNLELPMSIRQNMRYPHLPTMLATDPTEAVHAELILPILKRYFRFEHFRFLGGGLAYLLLTHNDALHSQPEDQTRDHVARVMDADAELMEADPQTSLFAYWIARPDPDRDNDAAQLRAWTEEEDEREAAAGAAGGRYYPPTAIADLSEALTSAELAHAHALSALQAPHLTEPALAAEPALRDGPVDREAVLASTPGRELLMVAASRALTKVESRLRSWLLPKR